MTKNQRNFANKFKEKKYFGKEGNDEKLNKEKNEKKYRYGW